MIELYSIYTDHGDLKLQARKYGSIQGKGSSEVVQGENHSAALLWHGGCEQ
jgi:hypothetical protein